MITKHPISPEDLPWIAQEGISFPECDLEALFFYPIVNYNYWLERLLAVGVKTIQLRIKDLQGKELEDEIKTGIEIAERYKAKLFINDHWKLAIRYNAYGIHLGQEDLVNADCKAIAQAGIRLGISTHSYYELARAYALRPSYIACGPIFPTTSKQMSFAPQGIPNLKRWRKLLKCPLVAIGGISIDNLPSVLACKVDGVAVISAVLNNPNPEQAALEFLKVCKKAFVLRQESHNQFSNEELQRYKRHLSLKSVGYAGQIKFKNAKVLCVGAGGIGSPLLVYLAATGIGTLGIVDDDLVDISNLQRQILFNVDDLKKNKAVAAKKRLEKLNPGINVKVYAERLTIKNAKEIFSQYDIIADGSDNFETRYLINYVCLALQKINVSASVSEFMGHCAIFTPSQGPCYNCLFPANQGEESLLNCSEGGILGVVPGILGTIQATEIIKLILGIGSPLVGKLLQINVLTMDYKIYSINRDPACQLCSSAELPPFSYINHSSCLNEIVITAEELRKYATVLLLDVREPEEHRCYNLGGINIPLSQLPGTLETNSEYELIVTYCYSGKRSLQAVTILKKLGFSNVKSLAGGVQEWLKSKL
ncbi:MAG: thiamine phosphate synthase [Wolbachia sp.]